MQYPLPSPGEDLQPAYQARAPQPLPVYSPFSGASTLFENGGPSFLSSLRDFDSTAAAATPPASITPEQHAYEPTIPERTYNPFASGPSLGPFWLHQLDA